jgi:hypothetical protein
MYAEGSIMSALNELIATLGRRGGLIGAGNVSDVAKIGAARL